MNKELSVRLYGEEIGILRQTDTGDMAFSYNESNKVAISQSLPLSQKQFSHKECAAFFGGFLPESEVARKALSKMYHISVNNDFSLLVAIGGDVAGALSFVPMDTPIVKQEFLKLEGETLTNEEWIQFIKELPIRPLGNSPDNARRISLAGAQDKTSIIYQNGRIFQNKPGTPSTHLLKTSISGLKRSVLNEYICMKTASFFLKVPACFVYRIGDLSVLLVERYDREIKDDQVKRIHQEDFCQALNVLSKNKYQAEGGPNLQQCFELLACTKTPATERLEMAKIVMFNFLIGNNDAHAKNFSLLYDNKEPSLAPAYDLLSTQIYEKAVETKMAMKIASYNDREWVNRDSWQSFCTQVGISYPWFQKTFIQMAKELPKAMEAVINHEKRLGNLSNEEETFAFELLALCKKNAEQLSSRLGNAA